MTNWGLMAGSHPILSTIFSPFVFYIYSFIIRFRKEKGTNNEGIRNDATTTRHICRVILPHAIFPS